MAHGSDSKNVKKENRAKKEDQRMVNILKEVPPFRRLSIGNPFNAFTFESELQSRINKPLLASKAESTGC